MDSTKITEDKRSITVEVPTFITYEYKTKKDKKVQLNMNVFHNLNKFVYNSVKQKFKTAIEPLFKDFEPIDGQYTISIKLWAHNNQKWDVMNIASAIDKLFEDALQELGIVKNDNFEYLQNYEIKFMGVDKTLKDKKCEITITEVWCKKINGMNGTANEKKVTIEIEEV